MTLGKVLHSPKGGKRSEEAAGEVPPAPADNVAYTAKEIAAMTKAQGQWLHRRDHSTSMEDLIDYEEDDDVGSSSVTAQQIEQDLTKSFHQLHMEQPPHGGKPPYRLRGPGQGQSAAKDEETGLPGSYFALHQETDVGKILQSWPDKDCPKFTGNLGKNAVDWLRTMSVLLEDCQAHPLVWHVAAGNRLSGKAFRNYTDAALAGKRPRSWEAFKEWLCWLCPLGLSPEAVAAEFEKLRQGPNKTCQEFYKCFRDWQSKARSIQFQYNKRTSFVARLTTGLSKKVSDLVSQAFIAQQPMSMEQVLLTALKHDRAFRQTRLVSAVAGSSGKRRADGDSGGSKKKKGGWKCHNCGQKGHTACFCSEPKSDAQRAWEKANTEKKKEEKKE
jgi:hypothetical protein